MNAAQKQQAEEQEIRRVLHGIKMPESIASVDFRLDTDWMGEPAARIRVVIKDGKWSEDWSRKNSQTVVQIIRDAFYNGGVERWPYVSIYTEENIRQLQQTEE